ncbi:MAG: hypothetical protein JST16_10775 [Bdellovibrionales bacterium]|nr:hypothetical protein [Bdellovibrionales bacterium]
MQNNNQLNKVNDIASSLTDKASKFIPNAIDAVEGAADSVSNKMSSGYKMARTEMTRATGSAEKFIRKNPLLVTAAAVGIGWAVGRYLFSNSEES